MYSFFTLLTYAVTHNHYQETIAENQWIKAVAHELIQAPNAEGQAPEAEGYAEGYADYQCPEAFDKYAYSKAWTRIEKEMPQDVTLDCLLDDDDVKDLSQSSGTFISYSLSYRVVYIGADSPASVKKAVSKLDNLLDNYVSPNLSLLS